MYRIRTKSKVLEANGRAFKLAKGVITVANEGEENKGFLQIRLNPLNP